MRYVKAVVVGVLTGVVVTILWIGVLIARMAVATGATGHGAISGGVGSIAVPCIAGFLIGSIWMLRRK